MKAVMTSVGRGLPGRANARLARGRGRFVEDLRPGEPLVEPAWGDNLLLTQEFAAGDVEDAMTRAFQVVSGQVSSQRITGVPIEPRGILASYDRNQGRLTFWESTQQPHQVRSYLAQALGMPEAGIRVIQPHVGGAFGLKQPTSQEEVLLAFLAVRLGRPLKWIEERSESLAAGGHARETSCRYQAAVGPDGLVTAMRVEIVADVGAPTAFLGWNMSLVTMLCVPTVYQVPAISVRLRRVVERAGAASLPAMRAGARARGRRLGVGIAMELTPKGVAVHGSLMNNGY